MTLILSCVTRDFAVQVSDRRLTDAASGRAVAQERNRAVVLSNRVTIAYSGLAKIAEKPVDVWLRDVLRPHQSFGHACQLIVNEATNAVAGMPGSAASKRHAFVAAGWARFPHFGSDLLPFGMTISNAINSHGRWLPKAQPRFSGRGKILVGPASRYAWTHVGGLVGQREVFLDRMIARYVRNGLSPASMAELLVREMRDIADRNGRVGRDLMVSSIPRAAADTDDLLALSGVPTDSAISFTNLRHGDPIGFVEGPHFVRPAPGPPSDFKVWREGDARMAGVGYTAA